MGANDNYYPKRYLSSIFDWSPTVRLGKILLSHYQDDPRDSVFTDGYYNVNSEAFFVTKKIFAQFYAEVIKANSIPIIVIFPEKRDAKNQREHKLKRYSPLLNYFSKNGYKYIDLMDAFGEVKLKKIYRGKHLAPFGNKLVAMHILAYINDVNNFKEK